MDFLTGIVVPPGDFRGNPMNLDRGPSGYDYGHPLNSDCNSGHSWADCGHIHWGFF